MMKLILFIVGLLFVSPVFPTTANMTVSVRVIHTVIINVDGNVVRYKSGSKYQIIKEEDSVLLLF